DDSGLYQSLHSELSRRGIHTERLDPPADLIEAQQQFRAHRLVVALRFHACVAAAAGGVPFAAITHERKLTGIARRLEQPAVALHAPIETITETLVDAAFAATPPTAAGVRREIASAGSTLQLLRLLL